ncbi:MAG TPA: N-6 DNA methylase [Pirellulales bacterium]|nr:N-6 DNA methylase [Pirellulales bacterium]
MAKEKAIAEFGDFQTPPVLAKKICGLLAKLGVCPASLLEPTCGLGSLLFAAVDQFTVQTAVGVDINPTHVKWAKIDAARRGDSAKVAVNEGDFFATDWQAVLQSLPEPVLVVGNPPWVTNSHLASLGSGNLPAKSNFQKHNGIDAITGKANFDISEWMLIHLLEAMNGRRGSLAMLCKSTVARKVLLHGWKHGMSLGSASIYAIDASLHFGASVDASLLVIDFQPAAFSSTANVFGSLNAGATFTTIGYEDGNLVADVEKYRQGKHLCGAGVIQWRSGVKHDCSKVMELRREGKKYRNGLGELVDLEDTYVYPMLKSSDVANGARSDAARRMIVTQQHVGEDTRGIARRAPKTWAYLESHAELLSRRASSIYRDRPPFSVFGVGDYSFAPWKVAISGFYKRLTFVTVGNADDKPTMLDDTSYFIPCKTSEQADYLASLLNSPPAQSLLNAFIFWDAKRPITVDLLRRLDLRAVARELKSEDTFRSYFGVAAKLKKGNKTRTSDATLALWPE